MNYTKYEHIHAVEDSANRSNEKVGVNGFYYK
jgi:hypothetical protein